MPTLAGAGILGVVLSLAHNRTVARPEPTAAETPAAAPYKTYIAASGIVEASTRNIALATPVAGTVAQVLVKVGDPVSAGQPLFSLDDRDLEAQLKVRQGTLESDRSKVNEAQAALQDVQEQLRLAEAVTDRRAISAEDMSKRKYAAQLADAKAKTARADVLAAQAQVAETQTNIERETIRAPVPGRILQINIRPGEYAATGVLSMPLIMLGGTEPLHVRVDIDEADQWRFREGANARAYVRGNSEFAANLKFEYVEPYIVPKQSLTGDTAQRVDTRVLQVIYSFNHTALPAYVGQQIDVFVETPTTPAHAPAEPKKGRKAST
jgi:RND family efflux transporter MFP subunit